MKYKWKLWLIPLVAVLALGLYKGSGILAKDTAKDPQQEAVVQTVQIKEAEKVKKENALTFSGDVKAYEESVVSARVAGRVSQVVVENGDAVAAGQPLVLLENTEFTNLLSINQATLKKAEANLASVKANHERFIQLFQSGAVSRKDLDDVETGLKVAEAEAASAAAAVANAQESLRNATVVSPLNGVVLNRTVNVGQVLSPGAPLMAVEDISSIYVLVNVEQKDLAKMKPGLPAEVTLDTYGDRKFNGVVEIINPAANKAARVFETKIRINNGEQLLKPGMFARVTIKTGETEDVFAVPQNALTSNQGLYYIFWAEGDQAKRQQVEIGQVIDQLVEIKSGLSTGQKVIVTNVNKLKDQDRVRIAD